MGSAMNIDPYYQGVEPRVDAGHENRPLRFWRLNGNCALRLP